MIDRNLGQDFRQSDFCFRGLGERFQYFAQRERNDNVTAAKGYSGTRKEKRTGTRHRKVADVTKDVMKSTRPEWLVQANMLIDPCTLSRCLSVDHQEQKRQSQATFDPRCWPNDDCQETTTPSLRGESESSSKDIDATGQCSVEKHEKRRGRYEQ